MIERRHAHRQSKPGLEVQVKRIAILLALILVTPLAHAFSFNIVKLKVKGNGTNKALFTVLAVDSTGKEGKFQQEVALDFEKELRIDKSNPTQFFMSAQNMNATGSVTIEVWVNDRQKAASSPSRGQYGIAELNAEVK